MNFFSANVTIFTRVRVQATHINVRFFNAKLQFKVGVDDMNDLMKTLSGDSFRYILKGNMRGGKRYIKTFSCQKHNHINGIGLIRKKLSMTAE